MIEPHDEASKIPSLDKWGITPEKKGFQPSTETSKKRDITELIGKGNPNVLA